MIIATTFMFFFLSSLVYLFLTLVYFYLWKIYTFGYYNKKKSEIIFSISQLFLWHSVQMATLMFMAIMSYYGLHESKYPLYIIAAISGVMELKYAVQFSYWSQNQK